MDCLTTICTLLTRSFTSLTSIEGLRPSAGSSRNSDKPAVRSRGKERPFGALFFRAFDFGIAGCWGGLPFSNSPLPLPGSCNQTFSEKFRKDLWHSVGYGQNLVFKELSCCIQETRPNWNETRAVTRSPARRSWSNSPVDCKVGCHNGLWKIARQLSIRANLRAPTVLQSVVPGCDTEPGPLLVNELRTRRYRVREIS